MAEQDNTVAETKQDGVNKAKEFKAFMVIIVFFFPILVTISIAGYGFIVWMSQLVFGPPGHG